MKLIDEKLLLISPDSEQVVGRIYGNVDSNKLLVLCHGFGVKSDSRGMYNHLAEEFKEDFITVRFHFVKIDNITNTILTPDFNKQVKTLKTVLDAMYKKYPEKEISIISHSQGCYITAILLNKQKYKIANSVLLSPLIRDDVADATAEKILGREGSELDIKGISRLKRTDTSTTIIPKEYWDEAKKVNSLELFKKMNENFNSVFVWPKGDTNLKPFEYDNLLKLGVKNMYELDGDHDFKTDGWVGLTKLLKEILK